MNKSNFNDEDNYDFKSLVNAVQTHYHKVDMFKNICCYKVGEIYKCRHNFPKKVFEKTTIVYEEKAQKKEAKGDPMVFIHVEPARNIQSSNIN